LKALLKAGLFPVSTLVRAAQIKQGALNAADRKLLQYEGLDLRVDGKKNGEEALTPKECEIAGSVDKFDDSADGSFSRFKK